MSEEYFDDASDADFLAIANQIERRENTSTSNRAANTARPPVPPRSTAPKTNGSAKASGATPRGTLPTSNQSAPKVLRPGFNAVIVNTRQKGNPILEHIRNVPWEYGDILPDFVVGATTCALFLSLRYHRLHPEYIYNRIQKLGREYNLRILLIMVDIENHSDPLRELTKTSLVNDLTVFLAWSAPEAGRYLETFKAFEHANSNLIKQHQANDYPTRLIETLTTIRSVNKNDAVSLVTNFGSLSNALNASPSQIATLGGWGPQKIERFEKTVTEPFIIKTGTGGAVGLGKKLKGGRWQVDQAGEEALEHIEQYYANAGEAAPVSRPIQQRPVPDERMPDEWNRTRNQEGEVVGFIGQRPIVRPEKEAEDSEPKNGSENGGPSSDKAKVSSGVMAALARLRQQGKD